MKYWEFEMGLCGLPITHFKAMMYLATGTHLISALGAYKKICYSSIGFSRILNYDRDIRQGFQYKIISPENGLSFWADPENRLNPEYYNRLVMNKMVLIRFTLDIPLDKDDIILLDKCFPPINKEL